MKTKTILSMTGLAASLLTSTAYANSYSINIPFGFSFQSNPLNVTGNNAWTGASEVNTADIVIPNPGAQGGSYSGPWDGSYLYVWTGLAWSIYAFDSESSDTTTGFMDISGNNPRPAPTLTPGLGYIIVNFNGAQPNLYTGSRADQSGPTSLVYPVSAHLYAVGSQNPFPPSGGVLGLPDQIGPPIPLYMGNPGAQGGTYSGPLDNSLVELMLVNGSGYFLGWDVEAFDSETTDTTTGFMNVAGTSPKPTVNVPLGGGFFFDSQPNNIGSVSYTWTQP